MHVWPCPVVVISYGSLFFREGDNKCLSALEYKLFFFIAVELLDEPDSGKGTTVLSEYVEEFPSFHSRRRGGMHLLREPSLTFSIILMFRLTCAKFVFLCFTEVVSGRPPV